MPRPVVLSNGELHVGLNDFGAIHDFYYPYVGLENHAAGPSLRHKIGVFVDGVLSWTDNENEWTLSHKYPHDALIGHTVARNDTLGIILEFDDAVDATYAAFIRNIHVINRDPRERTIKLFTYQAFAIGDSRSNTDTAQFLPDSHAILHYRGRRSFVISGLSETGSFDQHTIGVFGIEGKEGSYRDAEDGELSGNNVEHGRVDSILRFTLTVAGRASERVHYWIAAGMSTREALYIQKQIKAQGVQARLHHTAQWWHEWLKPSDKTIEQLPEEHRTSFRQSLMILKSHIDKRGAVIASTDTSLLNYSRDAYAYAWPRDGAYAVWPLIRMGYYDEPYRFFSFCQKGLHQSGYLHHKYLSDGSVGSSWHPYVHGEETAPPIQEDETAIVLFVFAQFYHLTANASLIKDFYASLVKPMADFLSEYIDTKSGLPKPSYDLWEEKYLTSTYTTAVTYGALIAASELAITAGDNKSAVKWHTAAEDIRDAAKAHLYSEERRALRKGVYITGDTYTYDETLDTSSLYGAFMYGLFATDSPEITNTIETHKAFFGTISAAPGTARYENDQYRRTDGAPSNWWHIPTLWNAQFAATKGNADETWAILRWTAAHMSSTGMLSEQINPLTNESIAPLPLTWSHAEYLSTLIDLTALKKGQA